MKLYIAFLLLSLVLMQACDQKKQDVKVNTDSTSTKKQTSYKSMDFKHYFDSGGVTGSIVVYDLKADKYFFYDSARCDKQFTPASTFKIPNSIIGLETGVIADENFVIKWDGVKRLREEWNKDLDLKTAIKLSAVPYYQELARRVGEDKMRSMVTKLNYGNMDISGGVDQFWLNDHLKISQFQQVGFLTKLYKGELPVSKRSMDITKNIILNEDTLGYKLRAKTGTNNIDNRTLAWWVGWVEKEGNAYFFATLVEGTESKDSFMLVRKSITKKVLQELKMLP